MKKILLGFWALGSLTVTAEPAASLGTPRHVDPGPGTKGAIVRPLENACPVNLAQHLDDDTIQRLVGIMISPAHYHMGNAFQARELLRQAASHNAALAERIFNLTSNAYDQVLKDFPEAETGDLLQLLSESAAFLPPTHPLSDPRKLTAALRNHAMSRISEVIANAQRPLDAAFRKANHNLSTYFKKPVLENAAEKLTGKQLPASVMNIVSGYSKALDQLGTPTAQELAGLNESARTEMVRRRAELKADEFNQFVGELEKKGLDKAKAFLLQPLARHFDLDGMKKVIGDWHKAPNSTSTISLLGQLVAESKDPRVSVAAKKFLQASDAVELAKHKANALKEERDELKQMADAGKEIRENNRKIYELAIGLGLNVAALIDPSPICSALSSGYCIYQELKKEDPDYLVVALSFVGMLPALGKIAVGAKAARQMRDLIAATQKAKGLLETVMNARRALLQTKNATGFLEYGIALAGAAADQQLGKLAATLPLPAREGLEAFTGLPFTAQPKEPFAAAMIHEALEGTKAGQRVQETCSTFDRRIASVKEVLLAPGKKIRQLLRGEPTMQPKAVVAQVAERDVPMSPYDLQLAETLKQLK